MDSEAAPAADRSRWEQSRLVGSPRRPEAGPAAFSADPAKGRWPFCIVWTHLPGITFLLPFIGHTGIADSRGAVFDFAGPYTIGVDDLAFGRPYRVVQLDPALITRRGAGQSAVEAWDAAVDASCDEYCGRMHNICCDNCHSHVARALNEMRYG